MVQRLTEEQKSKYVESGGGECPFCGSGDISAMEQIQGDGAGASCRIECNGCPATWVEVYRLAGVEDDARRCLEGEHGDGERTTEP